MRLKTSIFLIFALSFFCEAVLANVVVGVNATGVERLSNQDQDALIGQFEKSGVKIVRVGFGPQYNRFITEAFKKGIKCICVVYPTQEGSGLHTRPADAGVGLKWAQAALTDADPSKIKTWFTSQLSNLEKVAVHLAAFEIGNEINGPFYNGDFIFSQITHRQLGINDLNNPDDPEGRAIAASFESYLKVVAAIKEARDQSKLNSATPIISAGLASAGSPGKRPGQKLDGVAVEDTIKFFKQHGIDNLVDGYGTHAYPAPDLNRTAQGVFDRLNADAFSMCTSSKPCWLTEWGFDNSSLSCPVDEEKRIKLIAAMHGALETFSSQRRLASSVYYFWGGQKGDGGSSIYRCDSLTDAGKLALSPL